MVGRTLKPVSYSSDLDLFKLSSSTDYSLYKDREELRRYPHLSRSIADKMKNFCLEGEFFGNLTSATTQLVSCRFLASSHEGHRKGSNFRCLAAGLLELSHPDVKWLSDPIFKDRPASD